MKFNISVGYVSKSFVSRFVLFQGFILPKMENKINFLLNLYLYNTLMNFDRHKTMRIQFKMKNYKVEKNDKSSQENTEKIFIRNGTCLIDTTT